MRLTIRQVSMRGDGSLVAFDCAAGRGRAVWWAVWRGARAPVPGESYDVEVDIDEKLVPGRNCFASAAQDFLVTQGEDLVELNGLAEFNDDGGMVFFRLGPDCLVMIGSDPGEIAAGAWLTLKIKGLHVSPIGF